MSNAKRDDNRIVTLLAVSSTDSTTPVVIEADATTKRLLVNATLASSEPSPSTLIAFITDIPTAGTRVQLASNTILAGVLQAPSTTTGNVFIGGSNVSSTVFGSELQPGQSVGVAIDNTNNIWADVATNGDDIAFLGS